jgi:hypothetical protein
MRASLVTVIAALLLTSCQSYPSGTGRPGPTGYFSHAYDITGGGAREAAEVKQILRTIAARTNLPKQSPAQHNFSPVPFALYFDSRVQLLANRHEDYVHVDVTRFDFSGAAAFAQLDGLVRSTLSRKFGNRLYVEAEPDYSHPIITY